MAMPLKSNSERLPDAYGTGNNVTVSPASLLLLGLPENRSAHSGQEEEQIVKGSKCRVLTIMKRVIVRYIQKWPRCLLVVG